MARDLTKITRKTVTRYHNLSIHVVNENNISGTDLHYMDGAIIAVYGSRDIYYYDFKDGRMFVYRAKMHDDLFGCLMVRSREEYNMIYDMVRYEYGINNTPHFWNMLEGRVVREHSA